MTLAQEAENKLKKYEALNNDDPSVMLLSAVPHSEVLDVQGQSHPLRNTKDSNQIARCECTQI